MNVAYANEVCRLRLSMRDDYPQAAHTHTHTHTHTHVITTLARMLTIRMRYADWDWACETITHNPSDLWSRVAGQTKYSIARHHLYIKLKFIKKLLLVLQTLAIQGTTVYLKIPVPSCEAVMFTHRIWNVPINLNQVILVVPHSDMFIIIICGCLLYVFSLIAV
jgi:hypothetical protein